MQKKLLGKSNIEVSELCLGTMYFGTSVKEKEAFEVLNEFVNRGGNFIDTANNYCYWNGGSGDESELLIGKWLREGGHRDKIILASKIGARPQNPIATPIVLEGLRKETIIDAVEQSLLRLKTDYLDLCYIHADLEAYPIDERLEALSLLEIQGKIRSKGHSNLSKERLTKMNTIINEMSQTSFKAIQQKYSYLLPEKIDKEGLLKFVDDGLIELAEQSEASLLTYSVLLSGAYSRPWQSMPAAYKSAKNEQLFNEMMRLSNEIGCTNSQWVLRSVMKQSENIIPLISASKISQLEENIDALNFAV